MDEPIYTVKNYVQHSPGSVGGDFRVGDTYFLVTNVPFTLTSPKAFFERTNSSLLKNSIPCFEKHRPQIESFLQEKQKQVLLIVGEDESGKTHFLRDIVLEVAQSHPWKIANLESHILGQVPEVKLLDNEVLLLFKDDIDWQGIDFLSSVFQTTDSQSNIKLILTVHTSWFKNIKDVIERIKDFPGKVLEIKLTRWEKKHLLEILRLAANSEKVDFEDDIVRQFPNPYLLKYFGESTIGKPVVDMLAMRRNFSIKIKRVFDYELQSILNSDQAQSLVLCLIFNHNLKEFALDNKIEETSLSKALHNLELAGLIKYRYGLWSLFPDVKGDFYLASLIENHIESPISELLDFYISNNRRNSLKKIIEITRYLTEESISVISTYLTKKVDSWHKELKENGLFDNYVSAVIPILHLERHYGKELTTNAACNLCMYSLSKVNPLDLEHSDLKNDNSIFEACARFLAELVLLPRKRDEYFSILQEIWRSGWQTNISNYNPSELLANAFKPFNGYNDINSYKIGLRYIRFWFLESRDPQLRKMGIEALQTALGAFFENITGKFSSIEISKVSLPVHDEIFTLRSEALTIVKEALQNDSLLLSCFKIIGQIGLGRGFANHEDLLTLPSFPKIQEEIESCIPLIGNMLCTSNEFLIQKEAETILFKWWLWGISESMEEWLSKFNRSPEYLMYRNVLDRVYVIDDFNSLKEKAPQKDRWNWYWKKSDLKEKRHQGIEKYAGLVAKIAKKYKTPDSIALFLTLSVEKLDLWVQITNKDQHYIWNNFSEIVQYWVLHTPEVFYIILERGLLPSSFTERVLLDIQHQLVASNYIQVDRVISSLMLRISSLSYKESTYLAVLIQKYPHPNKEIWLEQSIKHGQEHLLNEISFRLKFIFDVEIEIEKIATYLLMILQSGTVTQEHFFGNHLNSFVSYEALYEYNELLSKKTDQLLREATYDYIKNVSHLDESFSAVLKYTIRNINHLIDLIEYRSQNWSVDTAISKADFQIRKVLPYLPFSQEQLIQFFQNSDNHCLFMEKVMDWEQAIWTLDSNWLSQLTNLANSDSNEPWIATHLREAVNQNNYDKINFYCLHIWPDEKLIPLMLHAWEKILPINTDEDMISLLLQWVYHRPNPKGYRNVANSDYYVLFWEKVSNCPILDIRLKMLIQQVKDHLKSAWEQELLHDDM